LTSAHEPACRFSVSLELLGQLCLLGLRGRLNDGSLSDFGTLLDAAVVHGCPSVVVDLAGIETISPSVVGAITTVARRPAGTDRELTLTSPSEPVRHLLDVEGLASLVRPHQVGSTVDDSGRRAPIEEDGPSADLEADVLRAVAGLASDGDVVDGALRLVVALARATVGGADGVSVSLLRHSHLSTVAASDQTILDMDASQYATGQGPCVDVSVEGRRFHSESLAKEDRWLDFTPRARELGINAILSWPLLASQQPVGALNIYSRSESAFAAPDQKLASVFAAEASLILTESGVGTTDERHAQRLHDALRRDHRAGPGRDHGAGGHRSGQRLPGAACLFPKVQPALTRAGPRDRRVVGAVPTSPGPDGAERFMTSPQPGTLDSYRQVAELSRGELWLRYFALGGMSTALQFDAFLHGALLPSPHDHDVIAHALNERFVELGGNRPVPCLGYEEGTYSGSLTDP
jgi:anti-anti-sigma regulatory factor